MTRRLPTRHGQPYAAPADTARAAVTRRLLPPGWGLLAGASWLVSAVVLAGLGWHLHRVGAGNLVDLRLDGPLARRFAGDRGLLSLLAGLGSPEGVALSSVVLAALAAARRWWRGVLLALLAAPLAGALTELVLKPAVGVKGPGGTALGFPSGHTTGAVGVALTVTVLLLPRAGSHPFPATLRLLLGLAALALAAGTGLAMVVLGYHRTTDVVGGVATAVVVVLAVAAALDLAARTRA